jgi:hypothetical protein
VQVCLAVRFDIPQDSVAYQYKDFANARADGSVGWPQTIEVTAASPESPYCAFINGSGTYFPILRRDFTAGNYIPQFVGFVLLMLSCCACSVFAVKKTTPEVQARTRSLALWTCASCFISFIMMVVLIPALIPGQCPPVSGWGYVYGFAGLCVVGCVISTCCTIGVCIRGNRKIEVEHQVEGEVHDLDEK